MSDYTEARGDLNLLHNMEQNQKYSVTKAELWLDKCKKTLTRTCFTVIILSIVIEMEQQAAEYHQQQ